MPYPGMTAVETMLFVGSGHRLDQPPLCPDAVYTLMEQTWAFEAEERPTFVAIVDTLSHISPTEQPTRRPSSSGVAQRPTARVASSSSLDAQGYLRPVPQAPGQAEDEMVT
jgi:hypothetical protein